MKPLAEWTIEDAAEAVRSTLPDDYKRRAGYVLELDHWQGGAEWLGPRGTPDVAALVLATVAPQFVTVDTVAEVLDHAEEGLFTLEPRIALVPREPAPEGPTADEQQARADEILGDLSAWWDDVHLWERSSSAFRDSLWTGRGIVRVRVPRGKLVRTGADTSLPRVADLPAALAVIRLSHHAPDTALVYEDPDTLQRAAVFLYREDEQERAELWTEEADGLRVRLLGAAEEEYRMRATRIPFAQVVGRPIITGPVLRQQQRRNFAETLLGRVAETAGFAERYISNAEPPGIWMDAPPTFGPPLATETDEHTGRVWFKHPAPLTVGAAITTFLTGLPTGERGDGLTSPAVDFKEPTDPALAIRACEYARRTILESCKQGHFAATGGEASGVAYQQARAGFESWLKRRKGSVENLIRDALESALSLAAAMGASDVLQEFRIGVDLAVNAGPVLPDQQRSVIDLRKEGLRSLESALAETGVEDVSAEMVRLEAAPGSTTEILAALSEVLLQLDQAELLTVEVAARMLVDAGLPADDADAYAAALLESRAPPVGAPGSGFGNEGFRIPGITDDAP